MFRWLRYSIVSAMLLLRVTQLVAQIAMPDTVCIGTKRIYQVNNAAVPSTYTWKIDGVTQSAITNEINITWNTAGTYLLSVQEHTANGCDGDEKSGLVYVKRVTIPNAGSDASMCFGTRYRLNGSGGTVYQWSPSTYLSNPNIPDPFVNAPAPGVFTYVLTVNDASGCNSTNKDTVILTVLPPVKIFAGRDTSIVINEPLQLDAIDVNNNGLINYSWSPGAGLNNASIKNPVAILDHDMYYALTASTADGCIGTDDIAIKVFSKADLYVPTAFTPNGDGKNDFAVVIPVGIKVLGYFSIYNRWGQMVFTTKDSKKGWNGQFNGKEQSTAAFVWIAEAIDFRGNVIFRKGTVTLIR
jgi:gliding motility-associated-like protein